MNHRHQLSTTAAADGLQQGSGLRRIACLAALLFIFVASGVRAAGTYTVTVYNGATISSNDYKALSALCSPLGLMNGNTSGGKAEFLYQSKDHYFTCNTSTYKCSVPATTLSIEKSFPITAYKTILQQSGTYTWLANYTRRNRLPDFPYPYDMWQFTDAGHVNGIRGVVDMNVVY